MDGVGPEGEMVVVRRALVRMIGRRVRVLPGRHAEGLVVRWGTIVQAHPGGAKVLHDDGQMYGWTWTEVELLEVARWRLAGIWLLAAVFTIGWVRNAWRRIVGRGP